MSYTPYVFRIEVYTKTSTQSESGQPIHTWSLNRTIKCDYMPSRNEERLVGSVENPMSYLIWTGDITIENSNQLRNLRDRYGNLIDAGPFNITGMKKFGGWSKVFQTRIVAQKVLE